MPVILAQRVLEFKLGAIEHLRIKAIGDDVGGLLETRNNQKDQYTTDAWTTTKRKIIGSLLFVIAAVGLVIPAHATEIQRN